MELTLEQKIGQMLSVGFDGLTAPDYILDWLARGMVGGIVLFSRNIDTPEQVVALTRSLREAAAPLPLLISIDQEGGRVARLRQGFSESPGAMALGAADSELLAEQVSQVLATEMAALGINWALAPVVDIAHNRDNPVIGTRSPGINPQRVGELAVAEVRGFQQGGTAATAKHFPGHGNTPVDTHVDMAVVSGDLASLWAHDLLPFRMTVAAGVDVVMMSHVKFEALDSEHPATLSRPVVTGLLRDKIGFDGLICSDCMEMKALGRYYGVGERALLGAQAGMEHLFFSHTRAYQEEAYHALLAAAQTGALTVVQVDRAVEHVLALKARYPITTAPDTRVIRQPAHLATMRAAARAGTVLLQADAALFPLKPDSGQTVALVEFASYMDTEAMEHGALTAFSTLLKPHLPGVQTLSLKPTTADADRLAQALRLAGEVDVLVIATRNAHLWPVQQQAAQELIFAARQTILLCLADPYDADVLTGAATVLCTCGDGQPSLTAVIDALLGRFQPAGKLPVALG